jgi:hypothetical protein
MQARRIAKFAVSVLLLGSGVSLAMSMLAARDLSRKPAMPGSGVIGGGGNTEDFLDLLWRRTTPGSWHAWGDGSRWDTPTRGPVSGNDVGVLVGDDWAAFAIAGRGLYDIVWVERFTSAETEERARDFERRARADNVLPEYEREERIEAGQVAVTRTPDWIPPDLSRSCDGFLPGRSAAIGRFYDDVNVADDAWMIAHFESEPGDRLNLAANHVVATRRIGEVRAFGWPFRAFVVRGAMIERSVFEVVPNYGLDEVSKSSVWWTDGLGVEANDGWAIGYGLSEEIEALPAKGYPWRPRWLALFANAVVLGVPLVGLSMGASAGIRMLRGWIRRGRDRCHFCGYARTGLDASALCPECGAAPLK